MLSGRDSFGTDIASPGLHLEPRSGGGHAVSNSWNFGTQTMRPERQPFTGVPGYAQGGAIDTDETNPLMESTGAQLQVDINAALGVINNVLSYGRKLHGLGGESGGDEGGEQQTAGVIPAQPFSETPKPRPMPSPGNFPYGPNEKPFGRRSEADPNEPEPDGDADDKGAIEMAGVLPSKPFSETPKPQPMPGPLPPTSNPFGRRNMSEAEPEPDNDEVGAIDTEETA